MASDYTGNWFLPNSDIKIPGKLVIDEERKAIDLFLYTDKFLSGKEISFSLEENEQTHYEVIHGDCPSIITLFNCNWKNTERVNSSFYILKYYVEFALSFAHLKQGFHVKRMQLEFPYLSTFFDGWKSINHEEIKEQSQKYSDPIEINEEFSIQLVDSYLKDYTKHSDKSYYIKHIKSVIFNFKNGISFLRTFELLTQFSNLLSFSTAKDICYKMNSFHIDLDQTTKVRKGMIEQDKLHLVIVKNYSAQKSCDEIKKELHQNFMLFSKWKFSDEELSQIIINWFKNENLLPIYDFYLDAINLYRGKKVGVTHVMFNNKFLNLCQALESYYDLHDYPYLGDNEIFTKNRQFVIDHIPHEEAELKLWFREHVRFPKRPTLSHRLRYFVEKFSPIFENVKGLNDFLISYPIKAAEFRNKLSHGKIKNTNQGKDFMKLYEFSIIILCFCILESVGLNVNKIKSICSSHHELNQRLHYIING